ncbi:glutamine--fructose-6-phosphate transaminase [Desulfacinum hydrothermale DSM 13146]|uniref:Glutamine--fructose-6-phosphate aminotransferase [isomerizing] n=1 Tax=Desulfacinum hydrothermale DSM 13146 TaxID=1121390 RepID=A0A1W1XVV9_9BACT|nr:glutamine--fructose-6-phosphate transaminase (isomerizing) [Desulfacinum hydrothermale]SMC27992.1 glutamine--fructose-6-phosphate transaminase [Desulfacinum hydrothermale DSM 13146]
MCGIVGYIGRNDGVAVIVEGLKRLEYRGYDSAGVAMIGKDGKIAVVRCQGKIKELETRLEEQPLSGTVGIGHTRWATHGAPSDANAHPHRSGPFAVVHNGIIENYAELKEGLLAKGYEFTSETDTEVIVRLLEDQWKECNDYEESVRRVLRQLRGSYAVVFLNEQDPDVLVGARQESPLILGLGPDGHYFASDIPAILQHTRDVVLLDDGDVVFVTRDGYRVESLEGRARHPEVTVIDWNPIAAEKAGYKHFMQKEIFEQPRAIVDTLRSVVDLNREVLQVPELNLDAGLIGKIKKIYLVACGTSYHACLVGKYMLEGVCRVPVEVDLASEFRYRDPLLGEDALLIVVSQSGETADTRAALKEGMEKGAHCRAIVNVVGSSLARMAQGVLYTHAGPEIGVASTKAFTTQVVAFYLLALYWARTDGTLNQAGFSKYLKELLTLPRKLEEVLDRADVLRDWARHFRKVDHFLYLGRGILYPIALEGALKLKEISYVHAEGYAAGEMKHGPIALIDENMPVLVLAQKGDLYEKMLSNVQEVRARGGRVLAVVEGEPDPRLGEEAWQFTVPEAGKWLAPVVFSVPLQLLAYYVADLRGTDVDQPRNLAKSVTVE